MDERFIASLGRGVRSRAIRLLTVVSVLCVAVAAGFSLVAGADTGPGIIAITPNSVSASCCAGVTLDITGEGFSSTSTVQWRGTDYPVLWSGDSTHVTVAIPYSALTISGAFVTVEVTLKAGAVTSNPRPVTIFGSGVSATQSAIVFGGDSATVSTDRLSAIYTRSAAGYGTVTAATYKLPPNPILPPSPISPVAFVDLQLLNAGAGDTLVGTFVPPNPIVPPNPVLPPNPIVPPNPVRLAYWTGIAWSPVLTSGGAAVSFGFDYATTSATSASVNFSTTSAPQISVLSGTVFAMITAYAFVGFDDPVDTDAVNIANAGRSIPLKWQVLDLGGTPVDNLSAADVKVSSVSVACGTLSGGDDPLEGYAAGASGLQNLGGGYYQLNWKTDAVWKGTCRRLQLDLGDKNPDGTPTYRTADFRFTR